jgi:superoxide dismutase
LSDRSSYVIAQMREINWNVVEERIERAEKIAEALK